MSDEKKSKGQDMSNNELVSLRDIAMDETPDDLDLEVLKEAIRSGVYQPDLEGLANRMLWNSDCVDDLR